MTILEMHADFDFKMDKVASAQKANFLTAEKDWLLNYAQNVVVKSRYTGNNPSRTGFEVVQKRSDDLKTLHVKFPLQAGITPTLVDAGIYTLHLGSLDYNYWFYTRGEAEVTDGTCTKTAILRVTQNDDLSEVLRDPFRSPTVNEIPIVFAKSPRELVGSIDEAIYLYSGTNTINTVYIEYIKKPDAMNYGGYVYIDGVTYTQTDCELSDHIHDEIVDYAVQVAAGIIESPDYIQLKQRQVFENN